MENEIIQIGDYVTNEKYGIGKVIGFDGTNIVNFNGRQQSLFDRELTKININEIDLLDHYETLPKEVKVILNKYSTDNNSYPNCANLVIELEAVGYTCDYDLDSVPYGLKKL